MAEPEWADPAYREKRARRASRTRCASRRCEPDVVDADPRRRSLKKFPGEQHALPLQHQLRGSRQLHRRRALQLGDRRPDAPGQRRRHARVGHQEGLAGHLEPARLRGARVLQHEPPRRSGWRCSSHAELPGRGGERRRGHQQHLRHERARARLLRQRAGSGDEDVVTPDDGILPDAYIQYFYTPGPARRVPRSTRPRCRRARPC